MLVVKFLILFWATLIAADSRDGIGSRDDSNAINFRLPNDTIPLNYNLTIRTNIHQGDFVFDGQVRINIRVLEPTETITIHYRQLIIRNVNLLNTDGSVLQQDAHYRMTHNVEFLEIFSSTPLVAGQELIVEVLYNGILRTDFAGFFRTSYVDPDSNQRFWLASTHFKNIDARHAVPCYDELRFRTSFQLQIEHHRSYRALSNMPIRMEGATEDFVTTFFEPTPLIPTHLLTFTVSNFDFISNHDVDLPMRVHAQPAAIARGQANHSLAFAPYVSGFLEQMFIPYSLPQLDQIAIPDLSWSTAVRTFSIAFQLAIQYLSFSPNGV